jgi:phage tail sheath gpL-like
MTGVSLNNIPADLRIPLFFAEVDNSKANTALPIKRTLILGQKTNLGQGAKETIRQCQGTTDAALVGGPNSVLSRLVAEYRANDLDGEIWYGILGDASGATAATGSIAFTHVPTANGTDVWYIAGRVYNLPQLTTNATTDLATNLAALINADKQAMVTATVSGSTVTLTADNAGTLGNDLPIYRNFKGVQGGEPGTPGVTVTVVGMTGGATPPDPTNVLAAAGALGFDFIICPYNDVTTLGIVQQWLADDVGRWSWNEQLYGHIFSSKLGSGINGLTTYGNTLNNQHTSVMGVVGTPTPGWVLCAQYGGAAASALRIDPARPLQTLSFTGLIPPNVANQPDNTDRNTLLHNGISTYTVQDDGTTQIENVITTYQTNAFGVEDNSYLQVETMFTLVACLRRMKTAITSKYARCKLADDSTRFAPGQGSNIVTPNGMRAELINEYNAMEDEGLVQDSDFFAANVIVERDANDPNRVNVLWPGVLIDQLRVFALLAQFRLQV